MASTTASGPPAASVAHLSANCSPTPGMLSSHVGAGPSPCAIKSRMTAGLRSAASSSVLIASENGTMKASRTTRVMSATARDRRPPVIRCTHNNSGQVATTIVVAQISAPRNGRSVQKLPASRSPMKSTRSMIRVTSTDAAGFMMIPRAVAKGLSGRTAIDASTSRTVAADASHCYCADDCRRGGG